MPCPELACIKAPFSDGHRKHADGFPAFSICGPPKIDFGGELVSGVASGSLMGRQDHYWGQLVCKPCSRAIA